MIANDILAYKTRHIVGAHILQLLLRSCRINLCFHVIPLESSMIGLFEYV